VIGVDRAEEGSHAAALRVEGADRVVPGLGDLIAQQSRRTR
jgi:hypothetical protein